MISALGSSRFESPTVRSLQYSTPEHDPPELSCLIQSRETITLERYLRFIGRWLSRATRAPRRAGAAVAPWRPYPLVCCGLTPRRYALPRSQADTGAAAGGSKVQLPPVSPPLFTFSWGITPLLRTPTPLSSHPPPCAPSRCLQKFGNQQTLRSVTVKQLFEVWVAAPPPRHRSA